MEAPADEKNRQLGVLNGVTAVLGDYRIIDRHRQSSVAFLSPILLEDDGLGRHRGLSLDRS